MQNTGCDISIIVPVYHAEHFLKNCLDGLLAQDIREMEIVLVDDGSTDGSGAICDAYAEKDSRVRVIHQKNAGAMRARKTGVEAAHGEYIAFADADDTVDEDYYSRLLAEAKRTDADAVCCAFTQSERRMNNGVPDGLYEGDHLRELYASMLNKLPYYTFGIWPSQWSKLFRREFVCDAQQSAPDDIGNGDDAAVTFPALLKAKRILVTNDIAGYHYRRTEGSITHKRHPRYFHQVSTLYRYLKDVFEEQPADIRELLAPQLERYRMYLAEPVLSLREEILSVSPGLSAQELRAKTLEWTDGATIFDGLTEADIPGVSKGTKKRMGLAAKGEWRTYDRNIRLANFKGRLLKM